MSKKLSQHLANCAALARQYGEDSTADRCVALADELREARRVSAAQNREAADLAVLIVNTLDKHGSLAHLAEPTPPGLVERRTPENWFITGTCDELAELDRLMADDQN